MKHPEGISKTITISCLPAELAELFWQMDSDKQAAFFEALSRLGDEYKRQMQWLSLKDSMAQNENAKEALMDLAAPLFVYTLRAIEAEKLQLLEMMVYETPRRHR